MIMHRNPLFTSARTLYLALQSAYIPAIPCRRFSHPTTVRNSVDRNVQESSPFMKWLSLHQRDRDVDTSQVRVKQQDGSVTEPTSLVNLLSRLDPRTQTVVQLSKPRTQSQAVVQITSLQELRDRFRAEQEAEKLLRVARRDTKPKQLEVNWAISEHDLELKLKQLEQFVEKGKRVEILLASKRKQRRAELVEAETLLQKLRDKVADIDAKEVAPMEGKVLGQAMVVVQKKGKA